MALIKLQIRENSVPSDSLETAKVHQMKHKKAPEPSLCMTITETVGSTLKVLNSVVSRSNNSLGKELLEG
jgi:hypothetical protein